MREYMSQKEAAEYCGFHYLTFHRHLKRYPLPRYGPKKNRYKRSDLDQWMENPNVFKVIPLKKPREEKTLTFEEQKRAIFGQGKAS